MPILHNFHFHIKLSAFNTIFILFILIAAKIHNLSPIHFYQPCFLEWYLIVSEKSTLLHFVIYFGKNFLHYELFIAHVYKYQFWRSNRI